MIDFGRYAFDIWLSYGLSATLIGGLVIWSLAEARTMRRRLREREE
ncbi:heme exporter protein CcmD [Jannaschia seosinensis]|uniref:Heme exporter protein D n=1 Tax=Jannaschia seosinensis TaxID=313367 RepID=A0A0M7B5K5_9RHOB|nr:heme exporter protein CcmD [Jannaschia seosinensis]CUH11218.1 heme exporter protein CcmD [Jannaschia seosinensis]